MSTQLYHLDNTCDVRASPRRACDTAHLHIKIRSEVYFCFQPDKFDSCLPPQQDGGSQAWYPVAQPTVHWWVAAWLLFQFIEVNMNTERNVSNDCEIHFVLPSASQCLMKLPDVPHSGLEVITYPFWISLGAVWVESDHQRDSAHLVWLSATLFGLSLC